jgi:hypothetical protein
LKVQELLGHRHVTTTQVYRQAAAGHVGERQPQSEDLRTPRKIRRSAVPIPGAATPWSRQHGDNRPADSRGKDWPVHAVV